MTTPSSAIPAGADERQPLLDTQARTEQREALQANGGDDSLGEPALRPKRKLTRGQIAWYALWTVLAASVLAVFIKGWIDSKDVNVRYARTQSAACVLIWECGSLTSGQR
jgi:hypothetical protein